MSYSSHREYLALIARFEHVFALVATERSLRPDFITTEADRTELAWELHERTVMHHEVNQARAERGLPPVDRSVVERAEHTACGHVDYAKKWSIYCADIVMRREEYSPA